MAKQPEPVRPFLHRPALPGREARSDEVAALSCFVHRRDDAVGGIGERAGAFHHHLQHGVEVEARTDAQDRRSEGGVASGGIETGPGVEFLSLLVAYRRGLSRPRGFTALRRSLGRGFGFPAVSRSPRDVSTSGADSASRAASPPSFKVPASRSRAAPGVDSRS